MTIFTAKCKININCVSTGKKSAASLKNCTDVSAPSTRFSNYWTRYYWLQNVNKLVLSSNQGPCLVLFHVTCDSYQSEKHEKHSREIWKTQQGNMTNTAGKYEKHKLGIWKTQLGNMENTEGKHKKHSINMKITEWNYERHSWEIWKT